MPAWAPRDLQGAAEVLRVALRLGLTSFGGPIAHLGYFERTYVRERAWLSADEFASLVALCQILPGPTSSQVGFLIGLHRAGWRGAVAAWVGFTLPSALLLYACARLATRVQGPLVSALTHGLKLVAVAVVAQAVWSMARRLCTDALTWLIAGAAMGLLVAHLAASASVQLAVLAGAAAVGSLWCRPAAVPAQHTAREQWVAVPSLATFAGLLLVLTMLSWRHPHGLFALAQLFYRAGALVFGGGHVVLPLLRAALVPGWLSDDEFLGGYGLAQAVPGPLFTVAAYLGAMAAPTAPFAAAVTLVAIFLPGLLLALAGSSVWSVLARHLRLRAAMTGVNAAVVGVLAAALYDPVWVSGVHDGADAAVAGGGALLLASGHVPPLAVVALCAGASLLRTLL